MTLTRDEVLAKAERKIDTHLDALAERSVDLVLSKGATEAEACVHAIHVAADLAAAKAEMMASVRRALDEPWGGGFKFPARLEGTGGGTFSRISTKLPPQGRRCNGTA